MFHGIDMNYKNIFSIFCKHMGDFPQPQQKSAGAGENQDFGAIWAGPSQTATFMPFWIYNIQVCKRSDMKKHF